jgi:hypothetical protein
VSELAPSWNGKSGRMPGGLRGTLVVVVLQVLANGFLGWQMIDSLDGQAGRAGAGVGYFVGWLSLVLAVVLLVCVVFTVAPRRWARPVVVTVESIAIANGAVNLVTGSVGGLLAIVLGIATIAVLRNDEVRDWYRYGRSGR